MGSIGSMGSRLLQQFGQGLEQDLEAVGAAGAGAAKGGALAPMPSSGPTGDPGAAQGVQGGGAGGGSGLLSALQAIEGELQQLEQMLKTSGKPGDSGAGAGGGAGAAAPVGGAAGAAAAGPAGGAAPVGGAGGAAPVGGAASVAPANPANPANPASPAGGAASASGTAPVSPASSASPTAGPAPATSSATGGAKVNIDGGNASGHGVTEKVDNNTGAAASFGWENAQGKLVGKLDLKQGQSGAFNVNADGPDGKSARMIELNANGAIPDKSNLDEVNLAVNKDGSLQVSADASQIDKGTDPTQIRITDGKGDSSGNGAVGGAYQYPTQDTVKDPKGNPMSMAMDTSSTYDNNFSK